MVLTSNGCPPVLDKSPILIKLNFMASNFISIISTTRLQNSIIQVKPIAQGCDKVETFKSNMHDMPRMFITCLVNNFLKKLYAILFSYLPGRSQFACSDMEQKAKLFITSKHVTIVEKFFP
jgi:hypothetical protein